MRVTGKLLPLLAVPAAVVLGAAPASAHTDLVQGAPGPGAAVDTAVGDLSLTFSSALIGQGTQIVVRDPRGVDHATRTSTLGPQTRVQLKPLTRPGTYSVVYRAVAGDGHPVTGHYSFRVTKLGAVAARDESATPGAGPGEDAAAEAGVPENGLEPAAGTGSSASRWAIGGLGAGCFAALLIAGARRRPASNEVPCA
jgi:methionine-rich copper-binding protein CopC